MGPGAWCCRPVLRTWEGEAGTPGARTAGELGAQSPGECRIIGRNCRKSEAELSARKRAQAIPPAQLPPFSLFRNPMVTGTSVLGVKFEGGVVIAADMLGSYGSLARFRNISRIMRVNNSTMLGASGDYADFQYLKQVLGQMVIDEELLGDGHSYSPRAIHSWLTRAMYSRRSKMNPLWNTMVIGGYADGESFLGYVDMLGVAYEAPSLATGYGAYLAQPLLREVLEKQPVLSQTEARNLVERCMRVLYYRDARSYNRFQIATVTEKGVEIEGPLSAETNWDIAHMISGFE
ncbi:proteasome subunit beta type-4 isoform X1 [Theropithecus gelada]|uniref:proteasome subunit beta type-4 isoform X1 n=1 Tax=Theropithecus gelada TaxID=9565 RepID=UPI000DC197CA|nr:proteasome subunit beta type-4 isoform X1 [Theropithecus gelada]